MTHSHGRCRSADRLGAKVSHGRWKTPPLLAALHHDRITAQCGLNGAINEPVHAHIEQSLVLRLKAGDIVVLYNLGSHKDGAARKAIRVVGVWVIFLPPPYSPDRNPIEQVFAKLETQLWRIAGRSIAATCKRIGSRLKCFSAQECAN
ncbi:transposase [Acetobacter senegalensis]|uniref:transposase n=1 Tax=Acetobacter senegalensis TaxID=446692 RepID=UPI0038D1F4B1|nr:transposase [Acetobacter senegalensis]